MIEVEANVFTQRSRKIMYRLFGVFDRLPLSERLRFIAFRALSDLTGRRQYVLDVGGAKEIASWRSVKALAA